MSFRLLKICSKKANSEAITRVGKMALMLIVLFVIASIVFAPEIKQMADKFTAGQIDKLKNMDDADRGPSSAGRDLAALEVLTYFEKMVDKLNTPCSDGKILIDLGDYALLKDLRDYSGLTTENKNSLSELSAHFVYEAGSMVLKVKSPKGGGDYTLEGVDTLVYLRDTNSLLDNSLSPLITKNNPTSKGIIAGRSEESTSGDYLRYSNTVANGFLTIYEAGKIVTKIGPTQDNDVFKIVAKVDNADKLGLKYVVKFGSVLYLISGDKAPSTFGGRNYEPDKVFSTFKINICEN